MPRHAHKLRIRLGANVRHRREERGWSQEKLAETANMSQQYLSGIEGGKRRVTVDLIGDLADALGVQPSQLLD